MASVECLQTTPQKNKTLLCAIYARKSTDENMDSGFTSLDSQREYCQAFIKSREPEGWRLYPEQYDDPGFSGGNMDRPALRKLIAEAKQGKFHAVVCYKYDRLSRNTKDFLHILEIFDRNGVAFVSVTQPIDTTSSVGRLMRSILMDFAQFEREMISERTRDKLAAMVKKGKRIGGYPVLGYNINYEKKCFEVNQEEAEQVKEIFELYLKTKSLSVMAHSLNDRGWRTKCWVTRNGERKGGQKFNKPYLWYLLRNPIYLGKLRFKNDILQGEHQPIISEKIYSRVQKLLVANHSGKVYVEVKDRRHTFLLKGLVRCTACQTAMTPISCLPRKDNRFYYYKCLSVTKLDKSACRVRSAPAIALEDFVVQRLQQISENQALVDQVISRAQFMASEELPIKLEQKKLLASQLGKVGIEASNLVSVLAEEGPQSQRREFISSRLDQLKVKQDELHSKALLLQREIEQLESRQLDADVIRRGMQNFVQLFARLTDREKVELINLLVQQVLFDGINQKVTIKLRPLPQVWGDKDALEGVFYKRKTWGG